MTRDPFCHAIATLCRMVDAGLLSHPTNDWIHQSAAHHIERAVRPAFTAGWRPE